MSEQHSFLKSNGQGDSGIARSCTESATTVGQKHIQGNPDLLRLCETHNYAL